MVFGELLYFKPHHRNGIEEDGAETRNGMIE